VEVTMLAITLTMQFPLDIFFGINKKFDLLIKCFLYAIFGNQCSLQGNGNRDGWFDWFMVFNATFNNIHLDITFCTGFLHLYSRAVMVMIIS
jgi:hypothetical protein